MEEETFLKEGKRRLEEIWEDDDLSISDKRSLEKEELIGCRLVIYWAKYKIWYRGLVVDYNERKKVHEVVYDSEVDKEPIEEKLVGKSKALWIYEQDSQIIYNYIWYNGKSY
eukprot:TRINITY_DN8192_c0_g1_i1.p1 TRINITY_DN8192_c0_g1~~TRINITY_DN8192_c0_g1_i1.p1  ORF type:complete len:112 (+),score=24.90 TRINITY_DN8192_c0_g1_i1:979-1314(+)